MKNPPKLTEKQFSLIHEADFAQLYIWYNELYPVIKFNSELKRIHDYINEQMREKA